MAERTLQDWLADSSDEEKKKPKKLPPVVVEALPTIPQVKRRSSGRSPSPTSTSIPLSSESPTTRPHKSKESRKRSQNEKEIIERRKKQDELKDQMKKTLSSSAVLEKSPELQNKKSLMDSMQSEDSVLSSSNQPMPHSLPPFAPPSARSSGESGLVKKLDATTLVRRSSRQGGDDDDYPDDLVEVMLMDRGTQTVNHTECQTDPEPRVASCAECYSTVYGHSHPQFHNDGCPHDGRTVGAGYDPVFAQILGRANRLGGQGYHFGRGTTIHSPSEFHSTNNSDGAAWKAQLQFVQHSVDMLINRYNLPPPPSMMVKL